jgi:hypothetical protein
VIYGEGRGNPPISLLNYPEIFPYYSRKEIWTMGYSGTPAGTIKRSLHQKFFRVFPSFVAVPRSSLYSWITRKKCPATLQRKN